MYVISKYAHIAPLKILLLILAGFAASGSAIYGWRFASWPTCSVMKIQTLLKVIFAFSAFIGNTVLSFYALLLIQRKRVEWLCLLLACISTMPTAVIAFNAFRFNFSVLATTICVANIYLVNVGINYMALVNHFTKRRILHFAIAYIGYILSLIISVPVFSASIWGVHAMLAQYFTAGAKLWVFSIVIGILVGFPGLFLMVDSTIDVIAPFQKGCIQKYSLPKHAIFKILMLAIALPSGGAYAEVSREFLQVLLTEWGQNSVFLNLIIHYVILPVIFICSSAVNYRAFRKVWCIKH